jgi:hypothetical protein
VEENIEHSMLLCPFARDVWCHVKDLYNLKLQRRDFFTSKQWLFEFLSKATDVEATILAVGFWHLWEARNDARNNRAHPDPKQVSVKSLAYVDMIIQNCYTTKPSSRRETSQAPRWSPPPSGFILVNSDAALFEDRQRMAMGAVIRDSAGGCLAAASLPLQGFTTPEIAEALALRGAVAIARDKGFDKAIFASDCLSLIQCLHSLNQDRSQVGILVKDIRSMVAGFSTAIFRHVHRSVNEAAHILARSCNLASVGFISDVAPEIIRKTLCIDMINQ